MPTMIQFGASAVDRVMLVCEVLQHASGAVTAGSLAMTLAEQTRRPWCKKTVLRDLRALCRIGYVNVIGGGGRGSTVLWQWAGSTNRRSRGFGSGTGGSINHQSNLGVIFNGQEGNKTAG